MKEIFISYSSKDLTIAKSTCAFLERNGLSCWISYRDIDKGEPYARGIIRGIKETRVVVIIFSAHSNISENVLNEMDQAFRLNRIIIPFKIEDIEMSDELKYYLSRKQWIEAIKDIKDAYPELLASCRKPLNVDSIKRNNARIAPNWASYTSDEQKDVLLKLIAGLVEIDGGTFLMGATDEHKNEAYEWEKPVHTVILSDFFLLNHTVTQEEWCAVMSSNPSKVEGYNLPVHNVTWDDCMEFIKALNELTGLSFRLPSEAQWEYAARGGAYNRGHKYSGSSKIEKVAWYEKNSKGRIHPVSQKEPNELGIYDMSGNVWEWCEDWYDVYEKNTVTDPVGALSGTRKVIRCSGANCPASSCRISYRIGRIPKYKDDFLGFRLVL